MRWHVDADLLDRYAAGALPDAAAWSVEMHVTVCGSCRCRVDDTPSVVGDGAGVADARLDGIWGEVSAGVRAAQRPLAERLLVRLGVADHTARLLAATPSLTASWLSGIMLVLAVGVAAAWLAEPHERPFLFLLIAPLLPVAGVAVAFGPRVDPTYDLAMVAPMRSWRLLVVRSVAVLATSLLLATLGALALPQVGWVTAAWLLPSLAMSTSVLALSARWSPLAAAGMVGGGWLTMLLTFETQHAGSLVAFGVGVQMAMAVVFVVTLVMFLRARERFDPAARA
jgi:Putative zinc-finger